MEDEVKELWERNNWDGGDRFMLESMSLVHESCICPIECVIKSRHATIRMDMMRSTTQLLSVSCV